MASTEVSSDSSSDSDASERNSAANYELELEDSSLHSTSSDQEFDGLDEEELEAYASEPLADDEWLKLYEKERKEKEELEKKLKDRFDGTKEVSTW